jgi:hypothetical protein
VKGGLGVDLILWTDFAGLQLYDGGEEFVAYDRMLPDLMTLQIAVPMSQVIDYYQDGDVVKFELVGKQS